MTLQMTIKVAPPLGTRIRRLIGAERKLVKQIKTELPREGERLAEIMRDEAPKKTGRYAREISTSTRYRFHGAKIEIFAPEPLSTFITKGTRAHIIRPKRAKFLRFYWPKVGRVVYLKKVNHPGTKPNRFIGRAHRRWLPGARGMLNRIDNNFERELKR